MKSKCIKCYYESEGNFKKFGVPLCSICLRFAPFEEKRFTEYIKEKVDCRNLETFRKFSEIGNPQKKGMTKKASQGFLMSRPPFGYKAEKNKLVLGQNSNEVVEIFEGFLESKINLTKISQKHKISINGIKKILRNFTYVGKIKFNSKIYEGGHPIIISPTLFNRVQDKLEKISARKLRSSVF